MDEITLYLGDKNVSPWSLRAWLMLLQTGSDFKAVFLSLDQQDSKEKIANISPSRKIPVLQHGNFVVWESLAIGEYLAELFPQARLWPKDFNMRAHARSIACEMHAGFHHLRKDLPFDPQGRFVNYIVPAETDKEIQRIIQIWTDCLKRYATEGDFLFGRFSIADAMFAPVVTRFITYNVAVPEIVNEYMHQMMALPEMKMWCEEV